MRLSFKIFFLGLLLTGIYGLWIEPHRLSIRHENFHTPQGINLKIVLLSDLHLPSWNQNINKVFRAIERENPDYVLIAGDSRQHGRSAEASGVFFNRLALHWRVVTVFGDKDVCSASGQCLYCACKYGRKHTAVREYRILRNESFVDSTHNFAVYGVDDPVSDLDDMAFTEDLDASFFNLLLIHSTHELNEQQIGKFDLVLAGNTHGGQVFFLKPFLKLHDEKLDKRYTGGAYTVGKSCLIVSRGVGTSYVPVRLGVPPEMVVISVGEGNDD